MPEGVGPIDVGSPVTTAQQPELLLPRTAGDPDGEAVWTPTATQTWLELEERSRRFANGLRTLGLEPFDSFGILAANTIEWAEMNVGTARSGCRYVPLNWHLTPREVAELLEDSASRFLILDEANETTGREAAALAGLTDILVLGPEYESWLAAQSDDTLPDGPIGNPLQYTGGTTGRSKGVVRADGEAKASEFVQRWGGWGGLARMPTDGRAMLATPAYHALGGAIIRAALARGHDLAILPDWDPQLVLDVIRDRQITATAMVPTQFIRMLKLPDDVRAAADVSSLQWVLHTAAPCPPWAKRAMIDWWGPVITELYGSSEGTGPVICGSEEWLAKPGTVGKASGILELSIVDDDGNDLPPGEIGTIYVKRADGAPKYFGDDEKSKSILLPDGRFTVGDVGWLDEDDYLFLADRRVDLILSGGTNIYPAEIEGVLSEHPLLADVAVFGIPNADWGQEIKAVVEPAAGVEVDEESVLAFAREHLPRFKVPRSVDIVAALPREASGKLKKRLLRDPYWP